MKPVRMRIDRIVDFGTVVSLVGVDLETALPVSIHVDYRPFAVFRKTLRHQSRAPSPIEYEADRLALHLNLVPAAEGKAAQLIELNGSRSANRANRNSVRGLDR